MPARIRTARITGLLYFALAVSGALGFLLVRPLLYAEGDPAATLANVLAHEPLARAGVALEMLIVVTQALAAAWFYRLFRAADQFAAIGIAAFGLVNAIAVLVSAALLATAVEVAVSPVGDAAATVQLLYLVSGNLWGVGALFFGLWLIPMGWCVLRSGWMPRALGWTLIVGGVGYLLNAFANYLAPGASAAVDALTVPASVGEFWMIGYLLVRGVRRHGPVEAAQQVPHPA
ncbi:MAG: DUF4386 domain-containing protein [Actinobacteria bacterium]|nr:DUF4386 domain-containing protein [Actinomycetota bacterium]